MHQPEFGRLASNGATFFNSLFVENLPPENLCIYNGRNSAWTGPNLESSVNPFEDIIQAIESCPAGKEDGILVFWIGYGCIYTNDFLFYIDTPKNGNGVDANGDDADGDDNDPGIFFKRTDISMALKKKQIRFAGLITDAGRQFSINKKNQVRLVPGTERITPLMNSLFLESQGFLDINSTHMGQTPILLENYGSSMLEAFAEFLETHGKPSAQWSEFVEEMNGTMASHFPGNKQVIDVFSIPKSQGSEPNQTIVEGSGIAPPSDNETTFVNKCMETSDVESAKPPAGAGLPIADPTHSPETMAVPVPQASEVEKAFMRGAETWKMDWEEIKAHMQDQIRSTRSELYPSATRPSNNILRYWSTPNFSPEPGDLLIGMNNRMITNHSNFLAAIHTSPRIIYLTVIDHKTGIVHLLRTRMNGSAHPDRLGLEITDFPPAGALIVGGAPGSPVTRCQQNLCPFHFRYNPLPYPPEEAALAASAAVPAPAPAPAPTGTPVPAPMASAPAAPEVPNTTAPPIAPIQPAPIPNQGGQTIDL